MVCKARHSSFIGAVYIFLVLTSHHKDLFVQMQCAWSDYEGLCLLSAPTEIFFVYRSTLTSGKSFHKLPYRTTPAPHCVYALTKLSTMALIGGTANGTPLIKASGLLLSRALGFLCQEVLTRLKVHGTGVSSDVSKRSRSFCRSYMKSRVPDLII